MREEENKVKKSKKRNFRKDDDGRGEGCGSGELKRIVRGQFKRKKNSLFSYE